MMINIPEIYVNDLSDITEGLFYEEIAEEYDVFFRRVFDLMLGNEVDRCTPIVLMVCEDFESFIYLDSTNLQECLKRALKYFEWIEEYEACAIILPFINEEATLIG